jgi:hypothetical protein
MHGGPSQDRYVRLQAPIESRERPALAHSRCRTPLVRKRTKKIPPLLGSPWTFRQRGQSGLWVSDLLPETASLCGRSLRDPKAFTLRDKPTAKPPCACIPALRTWSVRPSAPGSHTDWDPRTKTFRDSSRSVLPAPTAARRTTPSAFLPAAYQGTPIGSADVPMAQAEIPFPQEPRPLRSHNNDTSSTSFNA